MIRTDEKRLFPGNFVQEMAHYQMVMGKKQLVMTKKQMEMTAPCAGRRHYQMVMPKKQLAMRHYQMLIGHFRAGIAGFLSGNPLLPGRD